MNTPEGRAARAEAELISQLLREVGEATPDLVYAKDLNSRMIFANPAVLKMVGKTWDDIRGKSDPEWHDIPEEAVHFVEADASVMASGVAHSFEEILTGPAGTEVFLSTKGPLRSADGSVIGMFGISKNITARKNDEIRRRLLMEELNHRVKNSLAIVQSMARHTLKNASIERAVWDVFEQRLIAMSRAHDILTRETWAAADVSTIVQETVAASGADAEGRFDIDGSRAWVDAQTALSLSMVIHELATNASKFGALSLPDGRVRISWSIETDGAGKSGVDFLWTESGGPKVVPPSRRGFGSRLIEGVFGRGGDDAAQVDYRPSGLAFQVRLPLSGDGLRLSLGQEMANDADLEQLKSTTRRVFADTPDDAAPGGA